MRPPNDVEEVYAGPLFRVEVLRWQGRRRDVVRHPGAAAVVAVTPGDEVVLVRQLREALGSSILELPAGIFDVDRERPDETARRELEEETGYRAGRLEPLGRIHPSPGFADEEIHLFRGRAHRVGGPEAGIDVVTMPLSEAVAAAAAGDITDAKTVVGLLRAGGRPLR